MIRRTWSPCVAMSKPADGRAAPARRQQGDEHLDHRGLAGPVRAEEAVDLPVSTYRSTPSTARGPFLYSRTRPSTSIACSAIRVRTLSFPGARVKLRWSGLLPERPCARLGRRHEHRLPRPSRPRGSGRAVLHARPLRRRGLPRAAGARRDRTHRPLVRPRGRAATSMDEIKGEHDFLAGLVEQYPDRFSALAAVDPFGGAEALAEAERALERGFTGFCFPTSGAGGTWMPRPRRTPSRSRTRREHSSSSIPRLRRSAGARRAPHRQ